MLARVADALASPARQAGSLRHTAHRPWRVPRRPWLMGQTWEHLLFAHWPVQPEALEDVIPPGVELDTWDGRAWIAVTPFLVRNFRLAFTLPIPGLATFREINVRTYVTVGGRPGIWFLSLDADSRFAVGSARRVYRLPYFPATLSLADRTAHVEVSSSRTQADAPPAEFAARYRGSGPPFEPRPGTLEHFLTERYGLYTLDGDGRPLRGDIHHRPWRLRTAEADIERNTMGAEAGLDLAGEPLLHLAERQDVIFWRLAPATG